MRGEGRSEGLRVLTYYTALSLSLELRVESRLKGAWE